MAFIGNTNTTQAFTPAIDYFSGNASTTAFTLSRPVASVAQVQVTIDNVAQNPSSAFTVSANTITFTSAPLSGTNNIYVYYTSPITQVIAPGQGTVFSSSFASGASEFASGTVLLFQQTSAPTGWTKSTTHNNKALRVVSGSASSGGTVAFTTAFSSQNVGSTTLSTSQIPSHTHDFTVYQTVSEGNGYPRASVQPNTPVAFATSATGGGGSHNHSLDIAVQYVDVILAAKD
jgi:hypothetical protein